MDGQGTKWRFSRRRSFVPNWDINIVVRWYENKWAVSGVGVIRLIDLREI